MYTSQWLNYFYISRDGAKSKNGFDSMSGVDSNFDPAQNEIELELELIPRNHESPSPDSNPALELKHH